MFFEIRSLPSSALLLFLLVFFCESISLLVFSLALSLSSLKCWLVLVGAWSCMLSCSLDYGNLQTPVLNDFRPLFGQSRSQIKHNFFNVLRLSVPLFSWVASFPSCFLLQFPSFSCLLSSSLSSLTCWLLLVCARSCLVMLFFVCSLVHENL